MKYGSVCSGIEAASVAFNPIGLEASWFSEIADFPSRVLKTRYPNISNIGDMNLLPNLIREKFVYAPDILCGGTPCQAFSLAGWKKGLGDRRGHLTMKFIDIVDAIDEIRTSEGKENTIVLWENVEGVLKDRTNAFGDFIAGLAGLNAAIQTKNAKWTNSGVLFGPKRNIAWRVLDAKYFGIPQQRRRLFLIATGKHLNPEQILFEKRNNYSILDYESSFGRKTRKNNNADQLNLSKDFTETYNLRNLEFYKEGQKIEFFREYTDCLYSAYGTKWNGNAAAYNGSLYILQNNKLRRLTPLECERLMGFPDNYTLIPNCKDTNRYQAVGNSWAIPVVRWIGTRIKSHRKLNIKSDRWINILSNPIKRKEFSLYLFSEKEIMLSSSVSINLSPAPNEIIESSLIDIVDIYASEKLYLSKKGRLGILRRKSENNLRMNPKLEQIMSTNL